VIAMKRIAVLTLALCYSVLAGAGDLFGEQGLTASRIVEKNVAARGGLEAWRKIQSMVWVGHIESANAPAPNLPFVLEMKRPNKSRFEIRLQNQTSVRMFDGTRGWKLHPVSHGKPQAQPYTPDELSFARDAQGIDGLLIDYQEKGYAVSLDGDDEIDGHKAYRLNVTLPSGDSHHVWIDARTFLDIKYDRKSYNGSGQAAVLSVHYRNFNAIGGLQIPLVIETRADNAKATDRMLIDNVTLNPQLEDRNFTWTDKPGRTTGRNNLHAAKSPGFQLQRSVTGFREAQ
jgi:outer membrane lipoprotein-sorting protein